MAGGESEVSPGDGQWDVVLSFAGAQRDYVAQVAEDLRKQGVRCFYDADEEVGLWGKHLTEELPAIYGEQAAAVVVFISAEYAARDWTRLESQAALARAVRERREYVLPARFDDTRLPGLLPDIVAVDLRTRTPRQFAAMIANKLVALGITLPAPGGGENLAHDAEAAQPTGAVRAGEADLRRLGVHAAISVPGASEGVPPEYVPRDVDAAGHGVRAKVAAAALRGGFVLLVGGSSVGKTRCAAETVIGLLPDWWLVHPDGPVEVATLAATPPARTVIWLDELQRYLDGEHGLTGGMVRALLNARGPVVIIGTLWPDRYAAYTMLPASGGADPHAREREVLELAEIIRISGEFSRAEQNRARAAAVCDPRLAAALGAAGYGLTQTLAAAPQLVTRWEDAKTTDPYAWAVLTAALDVARLGASVPLSTELLRAAAPGYCTSQQQAEAPDNWFEQGLAYATVKLHGATAPLCQVGAGMGKIAGHSVADYLLQYANRVRRTERIPAGTWRALLTHVKDPGDAHKLADSAAGRLLYRYAIPLYESAVDAGDQDAARPLADLLVRCGDLSGLQALAETGDQHAVSQLVKVLGERGDLAALRARADTGDEYAAGQLAKVLAERGDLDGLRARADTGDADAIQLLINAMVERGEVELAIQILRRHAENGVESAAVRLARLLAERGDLDGLRARAKVGDTMATRLLARLLANVGELDEAIRVLRVPASKGDSFAARRLAELLAERGDIDELRARAAADDRHAARMLARMLKQRGKLDELRARTKEGDWYAAQSLVQVLAERGDLDELRARTKEGDWYAAQSLVQVLAERGDLDELRARADAGDSAATSRLADVLAERGDLDELRARADAGDSAAASRLADVLAERGDLDELRARADAGDSAATSRLADVLAERQDLDELQARAQVGDLAASWRLVDLLVKSGNLDEAIKILPALAADPDAAGMLIQLSVQLLVQRGDLEELRTRTEAGDPYAADGLADLLAKRGELDGLWDNVISGNGRAAQLAADLLAQRGTGDDADRLRRFGLNADGSIASDLSI